MEAEVLIKKKLLVPKLRFKGFVEDWKIESLTKLYTNIVVGFVGTISNDYCDQEIGVQFIRTLNVKDGWFSNEGLQYVTKDFHYKNKKSQVRNGDIIIARVGANMGMVCEINGLVGEANSANVIIIKNQDNLSSSFYASYLTSPKGQKQIQSKGAGGAQEVLNISVAKTIHVPFLSLPEQQKIASFLSALDEKIQQLKRKKELLEQYKKGVVQQLFSGKLRFKDENGKVYPKWEKRKFNEVLKLHVREVDKPNRNYLAIGVRSHVKGTFQKPDSDPSIIMMDKLFVVKENDLIVNITFAWEGAIAIVKRMDDGGLVSHRFPTYVIDPIYSSPSYFSQLILDKEFRKTLELISPGGAGRNRVLSKKEFIKIEWNFPCLKEQHKIAVYLSSIDTKIQNVNTQITLTQTFKKGLLQQMFV